MRSLAIHSHASIRLVICAAMLAWVVTTPFGPACGSAGVEDHGPALGREFCESAGGRVCLFEQQQPNAACFSSGLNTLRCDRVADQCGGAGIGQQILEFWARGAHWQGDGYSACAPDAPQD